jgi:AbiJ N-terminal domain 4
MAVELFSSRNAPPCKELIYDAIKPECRRQIVNIALAFFEENHIAPYAGEHVWPFIQQVLKDEHGIDSLHSEATHRVFGGHVAASSEVSDYFLHLDDINKSLDTIEIVFRVISNMDDIGRKAGFPMNQYPPEKAIEALNKRLAQHCIGYKFDGGMVIRIDNELLYATITKELMMFLSNSDYHNINAEYLQAHKHFRGGDYKDCIVNCAKAFESTMKVICDQKGYPYAENATAVSLLQVLYDKQFVPEYLQTNLSGLRSVLGSGVPVVRNKTSGHGAGSAMIDVSEGLAAFVLNSGGASIKFLLTVLERK